MAHADAMAGHSKLAMGFERHTLCRFTAVLPAATPFAPI
jgi:hypothetical protein